MKVDFAKIIAESKELAGSSRPKLKEGFWVVKVTEASFGQNQPKTASRGMLKVEVVDGEIKGALTNVYLVTKDEAHAPRNLKPYYDTLIALGIKSEKIVEDCDTYDEVNAQIISIINKQLTKGIEVRFMLEVKANPNEPEKMYKNVYSLNSEFAKEHKMEEIGLII